MVGALMLVVFCPVLLLSLLWDWLGKLQNPYLDFFNYLVFAPLALLGLIFLVVGIMRQGGEDLGLFAYEYLREQFIMPGRHTRIRKFILLVAGFSFVLLFVVALTFYSGLRYSDTTGFCANFCHTVMEPHATTHANSSHSQVSCVSCHIAKGTSGLATRTKLTGARQVATTLLATYSRPIASPIKGLRPSETACRSCHRPEKNLAYNLKIIDQFLSDEANSHVQTILRMKIGTGGHLNPFGHDIHWHTSENHQVRYVVAPDDRHSVQAVEVENKNGTRTSYVQNGQASALPVAGGQSLRTMDCMDCHNRTGHLFLSPDQAIDQKLLVGRIPQELPYIKRQALAVAGKSYQGRLEGRIAISRDIQAWYAEHYPEMAKGKDELIKKAIAGITEAWEENVFPGMAVTWGTYASTLGHAGCFRCHNDRLRDARGRSIPAGCDICHIVLAEKISPAQTHTQFGIALP